MEKKKKKKEGCRIFRGELGDFAKLGILGLES